MIIREWRGRATLAKAAEYPAHFRKRVMPELKHIRAFLGTHLSCRDLVT
jgi:hypothetical protein